MVTIAILGAGLGGVMAAYEMREKAKKDDHVVVVSDRPVFQFTPSNPWVAVGWRKHQQIEIELEKPLRNKNIEFIPKWVKTVKPDENLLAFGDNTTLSYDYLIIATGPDLAFDEVEGLGPNAFTQSICTTDHAIKARDAFESFIKDPGPIVVGAAQGASCFGPAYEFAFILDTELKRRKNS